MNFVTDEMKMTSLAFFGPQMVSMKGNWTPPPISTLHALFIGDLGSRQSIWFAALRNAADLGMDQNRDRVTWGMVIWGHESIDFQKPIQFSAHFGSAGLSTQPCEPMGSGDLLSLLQVRRPSSAPHRVVQNTGEGNGKM